LTCSVPDLQFDSLPIEFDCSDFEVDSDGGDKGRCEGVVTETKEETTFANALLIIITRVSNQEEFD
jgi:hypothetical protein